jgi:hypothetical protein
MRKGRSEEIVSDGSLPSISSLLPFLIPHFTNFAITWSPALSESVSPLIA